jgi:hypothetical protein
MDGQCGIKRHLELPVRVTSQDNVAGQVLYWKPVALSLRLYYAMHFPHLFTDKIPKSRSRLGLTRKPFASSVYPPCYYATASALQPARAAVPYDNDPSIDIFGRRDYNRLAVLHGSCSTEGSDQVNSVEPQFTQLGATFNLELRLRPSSNFTKISSFSFYV